MLEKGEYLSQAFSRNIGLMTPQEQARLYDAKIAIAGLGGVGGQYLTCLSRLGVGHFKVSDFDIFSVENVNRQAGATTNGFNRPKTEVMAEIARTINPYVSIEIFQEAVSEKNAAAFLQGATVALDGIDFFNIKERRIYFQKAYELNIPVITCAPIGFGASLLNFVPGGMRFDEYFDLNDDQSESEMIMRFALGLSPSLLHKKYFDPASVDFLNRNVPSSVIGVYLCAGIVGAEVVKLITGRGDIKPAPYSMQFDPFVRKSKIIKLPSGNKSFRQRLKIKLLRKKMQRMLALTKD